MYDAVFKGVGTCEICGQAHNLVDITDATAIREFSYNYYTQPHEGCYWSEDEHYCVLVRWDKFIASPEEYINQAFEKRFSEVS